MEIVDLASRRIPNRGIDGEELVEALAEIDKLRDLVESGEVHSLAWCALSEDATRHYHAGSCNDFYRLLWGIGRLGSDLEENWGVEYEPD